MKLQFLPAKKPPHLQISDSQWMDWRWQLRFSLKTREQFASWFHLTEDEEKAFQKKGEGFAIQTTPYYASLAKEDSEDPIRKIFMPTEEEFSSRYQQMLDPLGENQNRPHPRVIHRYPDRLLFLVTDYCSVYCRYCTRKHFTGGESVFPKEEEYQSALDYIRTHKGVREVILSGGDPLTLSNSRLERVLKDLREIEHIEIIRIGSRVPTVAPMRIDQELVNILKTYKPVYFMTHFNHPAELTLEAANALELLVDHGVPCFNQMVLLNGVNNHPVLVQALSRRLLYLRVKPYYMFQCDPSKGTDHLRTSIENSLWIQKELWGNISGLMMPNYSVDIPGGAGKTSFVPNHQTYQEKNVRHFQGYDGISSVYVSPKEEDMKTPPGLSLYQEEWDSLKKAKESFTSDPLDREQKSSRGHERNNWEQKF